MTSICSETRVRTEHSSILSPVNSLSLSNFWTSGKAPRATARRERNIREPRLNWGNCNRRLSRAGSATESHRGSKIEEVDENGTAGVSLKIEGSVTFNVTNNVYKLYVQKDVREDLSKVLLPLERIGVDIVKFPQDGKVSETVEKDEIKAFAPSVNLQSETVDSAESIRVWQIRSASFDRELLWRFYGDENATVSAMITDDKFWNDVDGG